VPKQFFLSLSKLGPFDDLEALAKTSGECAARANSAAKNLHRYRPLLKTLDGTVWLLISPPVDYSAQTDHDHESLAAAVRRGRIEAVSE